MNGSSVAPVIASAAKDLVPGSDSVRASNPFADVLKPATAAEPSWLAELRSRARERFAAVGIPGPKDEEWRFTPVGRLNSLSFGHPGVTAKLERSLLDEYDFDPTWPLLVMVDGRVDTELSHIPDLGSGVTLLPLADAIAADAPGVAANLGQIAPIELTPFAALNTAAFADGLYLHVADGVQLERPVQLLHVTTDAGADALMAPRLLVLIGREARVSLVESHVGHTDESYANDTITEIALGQNSWLEHIRVQREGDAAWHLGLTEVHQQRDSHYRSFALSMGGHLARHNLHTRLQGENVESLLYGLYLTRGDQLADTHSAIFHDQPNCDSWEVYKGVLGDRSRAVFNGKVLVDSIAQKTDAKQTNRNLLLSDQARVDTKPQLEIFADDVRCTHGATIGQLSEEQRYYLRSRGIAGQKAEQLLIWAFAAEVMTEITVPGVRAALDKLVHDRLGEMTS